MPRLSRNALSAARVRTAPPGSYTDGNGLMLRVRKSGSRQWIQRITIHGRHVHVRLLEQRAGKRPANGQQIRRLRRAVTVRNRDAEAVPGGVAPLP